MNSPRKYSWLFPLLFGITIQVFGQSHSYYIEPEFDCTPGQFVQIGNDSILLIGMTGKYHSDSRSMPYLTYFNSGGELLETHKIVDTDILGSVIDAYRITPLTNGKIALLPSVHDCDFYWPVNLVMIEPKGTIIWKAATSLWHEQSSYTLSQATPTTIRVSDGMTIQYFDLEGTPNQPPYELPYFQNRVPYLTGFLASSDNILLVLDSYMQIAKTRLLQHQIRDIRYHDGFGYAVLTTNSIHQVDLNFDVLNSIGGALTDPHSVAFTDSAVWIANTNSIAQYDQQLQYIRMWNIPETICSDIASIGDTLFIAGTNVTPRNSAAVCFTTPVDSIDFVLESNTSLSDVRLGAHPTYTDYSWPDFPQYRLNLGRVFATVHNTGKVAVHSVTVRFKRQIHSIICDGESHYQWKSNNLDLLPGEEIEIYLDSLVVGPVSDPFEPLCFWTTGPNGEPDADPTDDSYCFTPDLVSATEDRPGMRFVSLYPNPSSGDIFISIDPQESLENRYTATLLSVTGQSLYSQELQPGQNILDLKQYSSGVYYVVCHNVTRPDTQVDKLVLIQ